MHGRHIFIPLSGKLGTNISAVIIQKSPQAKGKANRSHKRHSPADHGHRLQWIDHICHRPRIGQRLGWLVITAEFSCQELLFFLPLLFIPLTGDKRFNRHPAFWAGFKTLIPERAEIAGRAGVDQIGVAGRFRTVHGKAVLAAWTVQKTAFSGNFMIWQRTAGIALGTGYLHRAHPAVFEAV